jgi:acetyltransferase-like isoleucine patch superfamily enzyme
MACSWRTTFFIRADCVLGHYVVVHRGTLVGDSCQIGDHSVLRRAPMRRRTSTLQSEVLPPLELGSECMVGRCVLRGEPSRRRLSRGQPGVSERAVSHWRAGDHRTQRHSGE